MITVKKSVVVASLLMGLVLAGTARAQFTSGVEGTVTDPSGAVVPNAAVTIKNVATEVARETTTSGAGSYRFASLPAATYTLTVAAQGFKTALQSEFAVQVTETKTVNVKLELGTTATEVTITATPPPIETSQGRISGLIEEKKVENLPLVGRNFFTLVVLTPGVTGLPSGGGQSYAQATGDIFTTEYGVALNANGQRGMANQFAVDSANTNNVCHGGLTNFSPNADSVQEVRVSTNNFSCDTGRQASVIVNTVTKSGSNDWHGTVSWFHTDNKLQSRNIFQLPTGPVFRRNEGAWSFGGPIRKDKTFFFASMDFLRSGVGYGFPVRVATSQMINFMQSNLPNNISTHLWSTYPASSTAVRNFATAGSETGSNCTTGQVIATPLGSMPCEFPMVGEGDFAATVPRNGLQWSTRIDHNFNNSRDRLYGNIYRTTLDTVLFNSPNVYPAFSKPWKQYTQYMNVNETHTFSPNMLNEMGFSYLRAWGDNVCDPCEVPGISVVGMNGFGQGWGPGTFIQNNYEWRDVVAINRGAHNLKTGLTFQRTEDLNDFGRIITRPNFNFNSVFDFAMDTPFSEGNIGIDPLTGAPITSDKRYTAIRESNLGAFVQDDWKVKPNLTINFGVRYELFLNGIQRYGATQLYPGSSGDMTSNVQNLRVDYSPDGRHLLKGSDYNNFAPRFSFAWDPTNKGKMSIRGGTGVFYNRLMTCMYASKLDNLPRVANVGVSVQTPPALPVYGLGASGTEPFGFPTVTGITPGLDANNGLLVGRANIAGPDPNLRVPYAFNWFVGVQYALANNWMVEVNYIGSSGHKLLTQYDVNRFAGDLIVNNGNLIRLNPSFGQIGLTSAEVNSYYTGGTIALKKRFGRGFSFDTAYTFGKAIDGTDIGGGGNEINSAVADITNLRRERGLAVFDVRQRLALSVLWQLPRPNTGSRFVNGFLGGWQLSNVTILQSGIPYSVFCGLPFNPVRTNGVITGNSGCDYNADGNNYDYPNQPSFGNFKTGNRSAFINGLFTAADFPTPALGQEGNLGRDTYIGPGYANTDFSITKNTHIPWFLGKEGANFQFRTEFYNLFNRVNLTQVNGDLGNPFFGRSTSTFGSRNIQVGIRIAF
jgi:hypothetical protein